MVATTAPVRPNTLDTAEHPLHDGTVSGTLRDAPPSAKRKVSPKLSLNADVPLPNTKASNTPDNTSMVPIVPVASSNQRLLFGVCAVKVVPVAGVNVVVFGIVTVAEVFVAVTVPVPLTPNDAPVPTTIAAVVFVLLVIVLNAVPPAVANTGEVTCPVASTQTHERVDCVVLS